MILKTEKNKSFYICKEHCRACSKTLYQPVKEVFSLVPKNFVGVDIGAHIGAWGILLQEHCSRLYSFEPNVECYKVLKKNAELYPCIIPINSAVWNKETELNSFTENSSSYQSHIYDYLPDDYITTSIKIKADKLDNLIHEKIDFIKIDAEGSEIHILEGAIKVLTKYKPVIIIEFCKLPLINHKKNPTDFFTLIGKCGYKINQKKTLDFLNSMQLKDITNLVFT